MISVEKNENEGPIKWTVFSTVWKDEAVNQNPHFQSALELASKFSSHKSVRIFTRNPVDKKYFWPLLFNDERDSWMKMRILGRPQKFQFWSTKYQMGWYFFGYTRYVTFIHWRACHYEFLCFLCFAQLRWSLWCLIYMG